MDNTHRIVQVKGHYEVHDSNGNFVLSGDTWDECYNDMVDMLVAEARAENRMENIREAEKKSFAEIGNIVGKSRQQVAQIYYKSIARGC